MIAIPASGVAAAVLLGLLMLDERDNPVHIADQLHLDGRRHGEYARTAEEEPDYQASFEAHKRDQMRERLASLPKGGKKRRKAKTRSLFGFRPGRADRPYYQGQKSLFNPDFFTDDEGEVHPIRGTKDYEHLATYAGQRELDTETRRELHASGYRVPLQAARHQEQEQRGAERQFRLDTPIKRDRWMRGWSRDHLIGLAEYADVRLARMGSAEWLRELDPYKVFEYHDRALSAKEKRSYGLPGGPNSQGDYVHARNARKKRREIQRRAA